MVAINIVEKCDIILLEVFGFIKIPFMLLILSIFVRFLFPFLHNFLIWFFTFLILAPSWNPFSSQFQTTSWNHFWFLYTTGFAFLFIDCHVMIAFYALIPFLPALVWWLSPVIVAEKWTGVRVHFRTEIKLAFKLLNTLNSTHTAAKLKKENVYMNYEIKKVFLSIDYYCWCWQNFSFGFVCDFWLNILFLPWSYLTCILPSNWL